MRRFILFLLACAALFAAAALLVSGGDARAFLESDPFSLTVILGISLAAVSFAAGLLSGDYSWVDRLWSTAPVVFAWIYAAKGGFTFQSAGSACLVTVWGCRLTANFARRGGYTGTEDYRWSILRTRIRNPFLWQLFNALFICAFQVAVLVLFTSPLSRIAAAGSDGVTASFLASVALALLFVRFETVADGEQAAFQARKAAAARDASLADDETRRGFRSSGLFRLSRHPAYFGELGFWWSVYLAGCAADGSLLHWSIAGPVLLTAVFIGSTRFTESISAAKYPAYSEYQKRTSAIVPWWPRSAQRTQREEENTEEDSE